MLESTSAELLRTQNSSTAANTIHQYQPGWAVSGRLQHPTRNVDKVERKHSGRANGPVYCNVARMLRKMLPRNAKLLCQSRQGSFLELELALDNMHAAGLVLIPTAAMLRRGELPALDILLRSASPPKRIRPEDKRIQSQPYQMYAPQTMEALAPP